MGGHGDDLREFFAEAGEITDAVVLHDRDGGGRWIRIRHLRYGRRGKAAVEKFNEADFMGRWLTVNEARRAKTAQVVVAAAVVATIGNLLR